MPEIQIYVTFNNKGQQTARLRKEDENEVEYFVMDLPGEEMTKLATLPGDVWQIYEANTGHYFDTVNITSEDVVYDFDLTDPPNRGLPEGSGG